METLSVGPKAEVKNPQQGSLSSYLYGIDWGRYFPLNLEKSGVSVFRCSYVEALEFANANYEEIFELDGSSQIFFDDGDTKSKQRYYGFCGDFFLIKHDGVSIGLYGGTPVDWSTYYIRTCGLHREYQGLKIFQDLLSYQLGILREHGVHRIEADVSPANLVNIHVFNKLKFNVTGYSATDRWGALIRFTRFFNSQCEAVFLDRFCHGIRHQLSKSETKT